MMNITKFWNKKKIVHHFMDSSRKKSEKKIINLKKCNKSNVHLIFSSAVKTFNFFCYEEDFFFKCWWKHFLLAWKIIPYWLEWKNEICFLKFVMHLACVELREMPKRCSLLITYIALLLSWICIQHGWRWNL